MLGLILAALMATGIASAQTFPTKTVRIVTSEPGGGSDYSARLLAQGLTGPLGQQVIVENRGGILPPETVAKAPPDGYTLLVSASMWVAPLFEPKLSFDPLRDFAPVALALSAPNLLVVHPSLPVKTAKDLIALAKARPGELNAATGAIGSTSHISAELFKGMAGVNIARIPYKSAGPAVTALVSGEVQLMFASGGSVLPHIKSGRLRSLGVTSAKPSALYPGMPTVSDTGLPGYAASTYFALFAPANTPAAIIAKINQETVRFLNQPQVQEKLLAAGMEASPSSPEQLAALLKNEISTLGKLIKTQGMQN